MHPDAIKFASAQRAGVLALLMPDGQPHGATLHFANTHEPFECIFLTTPTYKKCEALRTGETRATFVVGTSEDVTKTLQMDGSAKFADTPEIRAAYFTKFPEKVGKHPEDLFFTFTPTWWRFTDWKTPEGKKIYTSN